MSADLDASLSVKVLYATTTGTALRFAEVLRKDAFALHLSSFHFNVEVSPLEDYVADDIERERLLLVLLPTWTGGVPAEKAEAFCAYVNDLATDFRVSKDALSKLRYGIFGLGNAEYGANHCAAAVRLDGWFRTLSASPLLPLGLGDDSRDMEAQFRAWRDELWPVLCEAYALQFGEREDGEGGAEQGEDGSAAAGHAHGSSGCGCGSTGEGAGGSCGSGQCCGGGAGGSAPATASRGGGSSCCGGAAATAAQPARPFLPQKEWRRTKKEATEARRRAEALAARVAAASAPQPGSQQHALSATSAALDGGEEDTEEDRVNDAMLAEDGEAEQGGSAAMLGRLRIGSVDGEGEDGGVADLEDLGQVMQRRQQSSGSGVDAPRGPPQEMVTPAQRRALTKEGYRIIGSHSAVKLCRWTKAQLRGRGGCYKHSLYGITSYQCMEVTPSLACANKCVFCWRHHRNPVGREWRWTMDPPGEIVATAVAQHVSMIKELKGMPGLQMDRYHDGFTVRHCALSLVGEPIMYPRINDLLKELHSRRISTFLVTNAQFPEAIASLTPVTQLYVSIDAATKETLKAIDRPLFADYWERFLACLGALRDKGQRTVYRLTLIKDAATAAAADGPSTAAAVPAGKRGTAGNMGDIAEYASLVALGQPSLIEIKGVTYCGDSPGSGGMTMANVPWHAEVKRFAEELAAAVGPEYGLASEHAHSCCVLLARKTPFLVDGAWHTHIDFERFQALVGEHYATGAAFSAADYMARTPDWARYDASEAGFDPAETRWYRKGAGPEASGSGGHAAATVEDAYVPSESGCG